MLAASGAPAAIAALVTATRVTFQGTDVNVQRFEIRNLDPAYGGGAPGTVGGTTQLLDTSIPTTLGEPFHFAVVYDSSADEVREYRDGNLVGSAAVTIELGSLIDVDNWLGRSNWTGDGNLQGSYDEFRIYDEALSDTRLAASFAAGPGNVIPEPATLAVAVLCATAGLGHLRLRRRAAYVCQRGG